MFIKEMNKFIKETNKLLQSRECANKYQHFTLMAMTREYIYNKLQR